MKMKKTSRAILAVFMSVPILLMGCANNASNIAAYNTDTVQQETGQQKENSAGTEEQIEESISEETYENNEDGGHAIEADGEEKSYSNVKVVKTGDADGDEADFYGGNSAIYATNGAKLILSDMNISSITLAK